MSPKHSRWFQPCSAALSVPYSPDDNRRQEAGKDEDLLSDLVEVVNNGVLVLNPVEDIVMRVMGPDVVYINVVD